jgi:hypothetical protein
MPDWPRRPGKAQDLLARAVLDRKGQVDIGPVKAAQEDGGRHTAKQPRDDLGAGFLIRRGGKGGERHVQRAAQLADAQVIRAEIMAPLADAMRLIDRDHRAIDPPQHRHRGCRGKPLGRHVEQLQHPGIQLGKDLLGLFLGIARGQCPGFDPSLAQGAHLIAHQRNQRRDHHRHPVTTQRRQLETQRFPAPGRHDCQGVLPRKHGIDNLFLALPIGSKAKDRMQKADGIRHIYSIWDRFAGNENLSKMPSHCAAAAVSAPSG